MRFVLSFVLIIIGFVMTIGTENVLRTFGKMDFAEDSFHLFGGSRLIYKLMGVGFILLGFIIMLNMHIGAAKWIGTNLFGAYAPEEQVIEENVEYYPVAN